MTNCSRCGHPDLVHGGFARPGSECGYRRCDCKVYAPLPPENDCRHGCNGDCEQSGSDACNFTCHEGQR